MTVKLENLTDRPILLTLSSGEFLRISPGETSDDLEDVAVQSSTKIEKLVAQGVVMMHEPRKPTKKRTARTRTVKKTQKVSHQESEGDDGKAKKASE